MLLETSIIIGLLIGYLSTSGFKSQFVRILDVVFIGPIGIYAGYLLFNTNRILAIMLILIGSSTISYNLRNYLVQLNHKG